MDPPLRIMIATATTIIVNHVTASLADMTTPTMTTTMTTTKTATAMIMRTAGLINIPVTPIKVMTLAQVLELAISASQL